MDIRNWPLDKIMQLPDECFGQRWPIIFSGEEAPTVTEYFISEMALPERCVIWQLFVSVNLWGGLGVLPERVTFTYKLGDQFPVAATFAAMDPLFSGLDEFITPEHVIRSFSGVLSMRKAVASSGRRITLRVINTITEVILFSTGLVISSVPTEIPEWLYSGPGKSRY